MAYGWRGERIRLVPLDADRHLALAIQWANDPVVTHQLLLGAGMPMSRAKELAWFDRMSTSPTDAVWAIELFDGTPVGISAIHGIDRSQGTGTTGSFIADPAHRRKGLGADMAFLRAHLAFCELGLRRLLSSALAENAASRGMQRKIGMAEYGLLPRAVFRHGEFRDLVLTYLDREMFDAACTAAGWTLPDQSAG